MASADKCCALLYISLSSSYGSLSAFSSSRGEPVCIYYEESIKHTHTHTHTKKKQCFGGLDSFSSSPLLLYCCRGKRWLSSRRLYDAYPLRQTFFFFLVFHFFLLGSCQDVYSSFQNGHFMQLKLWRRSRAEKEKKGKNWAAAVHLPHKSFALLRLDVGNWLMASRDYYSSNDELGWRL